MSNDLTTPQPAPISPPVPSRTQLRQSLIALVLLACIPPLAMWGLDGPNVLGGWSLTLMAMVLFVLVCGKGVTGYWTGALIDERNVMSLSRFQLVVWTLLILSAWLTAALYNVFHNVQDPLGVKIAGELWWLMGVSTISLVASPLILNTRTQPPQATDGQTAWWTHMSEARWTDMFTGEQQANEHHLDMARLQMFFFTLMLVLAYAVMLSRLFLKAPAAGFTELPPLDASMIALITISHGGYLGAKARSQSQSNASAAPAPKPAPGSTPAP